MTQRSMSFIKRTTFFIKVNMSELKGQTIKDTHKRHVMRQQMAQIKASIQEDVDFLNKKTERVGAAIFLMVDLVKDNIEFVQPLIKDTVAVVSKPIVLTGSDVNEIAQTIDSRSARLHAIRSLIQLGKLSGRFSPMNADLIRSEIKSISDTCEGILQQIFSGVPATNTSFLHQATLELPEEFFAVKQPQKKREEAPLETEKKVVSMSKPRASVQVDEVKKASESRVSSQLIKQDRAVKIIGILSRTNEASIKDIAAEFPGVSEKTIQRDMAKLIDTGKVKTEGKRRWTRYFLA